MARKTTSCDAVVSFQEGHWGECRDLYNRGSGDNDHEFAREFVDPRKNNCVNFSKRHFLS